MSTIEPASAARRASIAAHPRRRVRGRLHGLRRDARRRSARARNWPTGVAAALAWSALGALTRRGPTASPVSATGRIDAFGAAAWAIAALLLAATLGQRVPATRAQLARVRPAGPWLVARRLAAWEVATAKPRGCRRRSSRRRRR
jgi:NitT/TauT family transport system permease protein